MKLRYKFLLIFITIVLLSACGSISDFANGILSGENGNGFLDNVTLPDILNPVEDLGPPPTDTPLSADIDLEGLFTSFWEAWQLLHDNYVDQPIDNNILASGAIDGLLLYLENNQIDIESVVVPENANPIGLISEEAQTPTSARQEFEPFWELWQTVEYIELGETLTYQGLMQNALSGMFASLGDDATSYMDPNQFRQTQIGLDGSYEGIGAWVDTDSEFLTIISPMPNSPAEKAGLRAGDRIIAIDGEDMTGLDGNLVISRVLGPSGSTVVLTIDRDLVDAPFDVIVTRAMIVVPTVESNMLENSIGYIRLFNFGANSPVEFREALEELLDQDAKGLIFDLRNNGGGYLFAAVNITSEFLEEGVVMYEEYGDESRDTYDVNSGGIATTIPLIVLVNEGSASASEITAGALQDYERGILVGAHTFGKGTVQIPITLADEQGAVRITIARSFTPNDNVINLGIEPDFVVELSETDIEAELDPQLDFAIELLNSL